MTTLVAVFPLFLMIGLGFAAARVRMVGAPGVTAMVNFVYFVAIPPSMIAFLGDADPDLLLAGGPFLLAMLLIECTIAAIAGLWAWRTYGRDTIGLPGFGIMGFAACFANGVFLGAPLTIAAFGPGAAAPALLLIVLDMMLFVVVTFFLEFGRSGGRQAALGAASAIVRNPILIATVIGLTLAFTGWRLPAPLDAAMRFVAPAAAPLALFALGATLALRPVARAAAKPAAVIVGLKLIVQPALAALVLYAWDDIDPLWRLVGIVFTAGPVGLNAYLFAERYGIGVPPVSTAIVFSTAFSVFTLSMLLLLLG